MIKRANLLAGTSACDGSPHQQNTPIPENKSVRCTAPCTMSTALRIIEARSTCKVAHHFARHRSKMCRFGVATLAHAQKVGRKDEPS
jgi:hypothetical protein